MFVQCVKIAGRVSVRDRDRRDDATRKLTFGMNLTLDGYIAASGDDLGWSVPSDELFQWWSDRVGATGLALYGRKLWESYQRTDEHAGWGGV